MIVNYLPCYVFGFHRFLSKMFLGAAGMSSFIGLNLSQFSQKKVIGWYMSWFLRVMILVKSLLRSDFFIFSSFFFPYPYRCILFCGGSNHRYLSLSGATSTLISLLQSSDPSIQYHAARSMASFSRSSAYYIHVLEARSSMHSFHWCFFLSTFCACTCSKRCMGQFVYRMCSVLLWVLQVLLILIVVPPYVVDMMDVFAGENPIPFLTAIVSLNSVRASLGFSLVKPSLLFDIFISCAKICILNMLSRPDVRSITIFCPRNSSKTLFQKYAPVNAFANIC